MRRKNQFFYYFCEDIKHIGVLNNHLNASYLNCASLLADHSGHADRPIFIHVVL